MSMIYCHGPCIRFLGFVCWNISYYANARYDIAEVYNLFRPRDTVQSRAETKFEIWTKSELSKVKHQNRRQNLFNYSLCASVLLPSPKLCRIVISCKIVNCSVKLKLIHKITDIQEKLFVLFNLLLGPDTCSGVGMVPRAAGCASLRFCMYTPKIIVIACMSVCLRRN